MEKISIYNYLPDFKKAMKIGCNVLMKRTDKGVWFLNTKTQAVRQLSLNNKIYGFNHEDYNWDAISKLENNRNAYSGDVEYGSINRYDDFKDGYCAITWCLYPDGRYFADEDGFGAEDNIEITIYAILNTDLEVVVPWQPMDVKKELEKVRNKGK